MLQPNGLPFVPGYDLLERVGSGGMGVVYRARHIGLDREVALKMMHADVSAIEEFCERFKKEARNQAMLENPNVVQVFDVNEVNGQLYISMEFCSGKSLKGIKMSPRDAARCVEKLALAIYEAHLLDIIHRDLKPANILLSKDGMPKIADFGLAKRLGAESGETSVGRILGTAMYMAPEQVTRAIKIGPKADIFALGGILYELLTGRPPFDSKTSQEVLWRPDPELLTHLRTDIPPELKSIILKCLQKLASARYGSALKLAEDLRRFQDSQRPVPQVEGEGSQQETGTPKWPTTDGALAPQISAPVKVHTLSRPSLAASKKVSGRWLISFLLLALLGTAVGVGAFFYNVAVGLRKPSGGTFTLQTPQRLTVAPGEQKVVVFQITRTDDFTEQVRLSFLNPFADIAMGGEVSFGVKADSAETSVAAAPLALPGRYKIQARAVAGGRSQEVDLEVEILPGVVQGPIPKAEPWVQVGGFEPDNNKRAYCVAVSPDARRVLVSINQKSLLLQELKTGKELSRVDLDPQAVPERIAFFPDSRRALLCGPDRIVRIWDTDAAKEVSQFQQQDEGVADLAVSRDGTCALICTSSSVRVVDVASGKEIRSCQPFPKTDIQLDKLQQNGIQLSLDQITTFPDGRHVAVRWHSLRPKNVAFPPSGAMLLDVEEMNVPDRFKLVLGSNGTVALGPNRILYASGPGRSGETLILVDAETGANLGHLNYLEPTQSVRALAFSPDGSRALSAVNVGTLRLWDVEKKQELSCFEHPSQTIWLAFSPDGRFAVAIDTRKTVRMWQLPN